MKNKSTIVCFASVDDKKNREYARSLVSESTLVNLVLPNGQCVEFAQYEGKPITVVRDGIEGDAEFLVFETEYFGDMFEHVYEKIEGIRTVVMTEEDLTGSGVGELDKGEIISRVKKHFEINEDGRERVFKNREAQRKSEQTSLSERQEYMLSAEEKERVLEQKAQNYTPQLYKRQTFEEFIELVGDKEVALNIIKEKFGAGLSEEQALALSNGDYEVLKSILTNILNASGIEYIVADSFFNNSDERKKLLAKLKGIDNGFRAIELLNLVDRVLVSEISEHELYSIIAEEFSEDFLKQTNLVELLGREKYELLKSYVWKMQITEKENKRDSLMESGRRYELGEEDGYKPHVFLISQKDKKDIDHSQVAMGYARQSVTKEIIGRLNLSDTVQEFEFDADIGESSKRLKEIIFSERALKALRHGDKISEIEVVSELLDLLKNQDSKIANHSLRVSNWVAIIMMLVHQSKEIPKEMKVPIKDMEEDVLATGLHDVGKRLAVVIRDLFGDKSDEVSFIEELGRNTSSFGQLPADARSAIINHSHIGAEALDKISSVTDGKILSKAKDIAGNHHKEYKINGEIVNNDPLINIVTLADCLDAIVSGRSYNNVREPMTLEGTIDILLKDMGGCIKVYREYKDERIEVKPGEWFMDENIKFHFDEQAFENAKRVKFNPYFLMMALKFVRQQVIEAEKGKRVHMSFNDETISPEVREEFAKIENVTEIYQIQGVRERFDGKRHLVTSFAGIPMEQNSIQASADKSKKMRPMQYVREFVETVEKERVVLTQVSRRGGDILRA